MPHWRALRLLRPVRGCDIILRFMDDQLAGPAHRDNNMLITNEWNSQK